MARIAGVDLPAKKRAEIGLTYIYGIGRTRALSLLFRAGVDPGKKVADLNEDEVNRIRTLIENEGAVEGDLAQGAVDEHQAAHRNGRLSGPAASPRPAGTRPANPHQRPHAQGTAPRNGRQQEEGDGEDLRTTMAKAAAKTTKATKKKAFKKKEKKNVSQGGLCTSRRRSTTPS
jgi:ribosomal protein S13